MTTDWSREEVEATVADYFAMLELELRGIPYDKSDHRRRLMRLLHGRSDGSVEYKHQNISAVLIELGFPYISGYKPRFNFQRLLFDVVSDRLASAHALISVAEVDVERQVVVPQVADILKALTDPPRPPTSAIRAQQSRPQYLPRPVN